MWLIRCGKRVSIAALPNEPILILSKTNKQTKNPPSHSKQILSKLACFHEANLFSKSLTLYGQWKRLISIKYYLQNVNPTINPGLCCDYFSVNMVTFAQIKDLDPIIVGPTKGSNNSGRVWVCVCVSVWAECVHVTDCALLVKQEIHYTSLRRSSCTQTQINVANVYTLGPLLEMLSFSSAAVPDALRSGCCDASFWKNSEVL